MKFVNLIAQVLWTCTSPSLAFLQQYALSRSDISVVHTVPGTQHLENLALRHNGDVLVTSTGSAFVHLISPGEKFVARVGQIPGVTSLIGIAELQRDVFFVSGSNLTGFDAKGTNIVWKLDMRQFCADGNGAILEPARMELVTEIPSAGLLNGMTRLASHDGSHLLLSDSSQGSIIRLNIDTKAYEVVIQDPTMGSAPEGPSVGVNGIHTHNDRLFYTNSNRELFAQIPISLVTGRAKGEAEVLINTTLVAADDFALSKDGKRAWIAKNGEHVVLEVDIMARTTSVAINSTILGASSAVALGKDEFGRQVLYATGALESHNPPVGALFKTYL
ncbi:hypothetical protein ACJ41O_007392 [Fusarium nematophilum]